MAKIRTWSQYDIAGRMVAMLKANNRPKGKGWRVVKVPTGMVHPLRQQRQRIKGRWKDL
jgi:hypothetical protein